MSDGHNDWNRNRQVRRDPDIRDVTGIDIWPNDPVWIAAEDGSFIKAHVIEILPEGIISLMTRSNSMVEVSFKPKSHSVASCNYILKAQ